MRSDGAYLLLPQSSKAAYSGESETIYTTFSALIAGLLNMAVKQENLLENFFAGVLMGLSTSKGHDMQKSIAKPLPEFTKENEIG